MPVVCPLLVYIAPKWPIKVQIWIQAKIPSVLNKYICLFPIIDIKTRRTAFLQYTMLYSLSIFGYLAFTSTSVADKQLIRNDLLQSLIGWNCCTLCHAVCVQANHRCTCSVGHIMWKQTWRLESFFGLCALQFSFSWIGVWHPVFIIYPW